MPPSPNRARLSVDLSASWKIYTNTIPPGSSALGTVTRDGTDTGALALIEATGIYVQVNAGAVRSLDQRKVKSAIVGVSPHGNTGRRNAARIDANTNLNIRVPTADKTAWEAAAAAAGMTPSEWVRDTLNRAAKHDHQG